MQQLRLIGLALFITAIFLAMAAAITQTTHIRFQSQGADNASQVNALNGGMVLPPPIEPGFGNGNLPRDSNAIAFTSVPIVWPLIIAGGVGLLMWFMLSSETPRTFGSAKQRRRN